MEFSAPITAIVGPNGSGKSNVAEAFRFVLGEQSVKSLRGKKGGDLIWGGSDGLSRGNRASVEVALDNAGRRLAIDFDEVRIERVIHRDGQNEYKINGTGVRLKDIHELLAGAHIGATGHHIISQGEADRIISATPKERRAVVEDALGLKLFQTKKQEAIRKLEKTQAHMAETQLRRREAAPQLRSLQRQVEKAERATQLQSELSTAYREYLKREDVYLKTYTTRTQEQLRAVQGVVSDVQKRIQELQEQAAPVDNTEHLAAVTSAKSRVQDCRAVLTKERQIHSSLQGQIALLERRVTRVQTHVVEPKQTILRSRVLQAVSAVQEKIATVVTSSDVSVLKDALQHASDTLQVLITETNPIPQPQPTDEQDEQELRQLQGQLQIAEQSVAAAADAESAALTHLQQIESTAAKASSEQLEAERALLHARSELDAKQRDVRALEQELQTLQRDQDVFNQTVQTAVMTVGRDAAQYQTNTEVTEELVSNEPREVQITRRRDIDHLAIRLEEVSVGDVTEIKKEYDSLKQKDDFLAGELSDLKSSMQNLRGVIDDMNTQIQTEFTSGIETISSEFNRFFGLMFGGGKASITSVVTTKPIDEDDAVSTTPEPDGVDLTVALPNKRVQGLAMLSGGERALTSIALIFAMSQVNPPPFIILDETDAALDEANSRRYGDMIQALAQKSQLILITHNRETMSRAGILYGVTMAGDGVSQLLSVKFDEAAAHAK